MSQKGALFSLLRFGSVHLAPGQRIIPKEDVDTVMTAHEIIEKAKEDASAFQQSCEKECERQKKAAYDAGFAEGLQKFNDAIVSLEKERLCLRKELESKLVPVAIKGAQKIVGRQLELNEAAIVDIIAKTLKTVASHSQITLCVCKDDLEHVEAQKETLKTMFEKLEYLVIRESPDVTPGGCIVITEAGIINADLKTQWEALEIAYKRIFKED